jgi:hypothetical protein
MQCPLIVALLCALACSAAAQQSGDTVNMSCVERLDLPMYPRLADAARISAGVVTAIRVGSGGTINAITSEVKAVAAVKTAFLRSVEDAVRSSRFAAACAGRTVTIELQFSLGEQVGTEHVSFAYPNRFTIFAPAKVIQGFNRSASFRPQCAAGVLSRNHTLRRLADRLAGGKRRLRRIVGGAILRSDRSA